MSGDNMPPARKSATIRYNEDVDDEVLEFVNMRLSAAADEWPTEIESKPGTDGSEDLLNSNGRFSAAERGVEIRLCDDARKGMGAYATRKILAHRIVGIYWGELLTARQHALRHGWRIEQVVAKPTKQELAALREREERLAALTSGVPISSAGVGAQNGSAYCFSLFADELKAALGSAMLPEHIAYIDCEDPNRSTWCRYVNHAPAMVGACNCVPRTDALAHLVWLEATRDIEVGEEVCFDYGEVYKWDEPPALPG